MSSKPATEMSLGTIRPAEEGARTTPIAVSSLVQNTAARRSAQSKAAWVEI
jgi:hypothetical protein